MPTKIHKDKCRISITEYEVRTINADGDTLDVYYYDTKDKALEYAEWLMNGGQPLHGASAVVVEKHISRRPAYLFAKPNTFTCIAALGDRAALEAGGWNLP